MHIQIHIQVRRSVVVTSHEDLGVLEHSLLPSLFASLRAIA
jgi:hypothetical protein